MCDVSKYVLIIYVGVLKCGFIETFRFIIDFNQFKCNMVIECCVPYCKTKATSGFHNFPANKERRLRWLKAIHVFHLDEETLSNSFRRVCNKHFLPDDYQTHANGLVRLKYYSVPSQCLPNMISMEHSYVKCRNAAVTNFVQIH